MRPPNLSVHIPSGTRISEPVSTGMAVRMPNWVALRFSVFLIGMPITPNIIQTMKHTVNASVLTTSTETAFAFCVLAIPRSLAHCPLLHCGHSGPAGSRRTFATGPVGARRKDYLLAPGGRGGDSSKGVGGGLRQVSRRGARSDSSGAACAGGRRRRRAPGGDAGHGEAVGDEQRAGPQFGSRLGPEPRHRRRREECVDDVDPREVDAPEVAVADGDARMPQRPRPGDEPRQRRVLDADEAGLGPRRREPEQEAAVAAAQVDDAARAGRKQCGQRLRGRRVRQVERDPARIGAPEHEGQRDERSQPRGRRPVQAQREHDERHEQRVDQPPPARRPAPRGHRGGDHSLDQRERQRLAQRPGFQPREQRRRRGDTRQLRAEDQAQRQPIACARGDGDPVRSWRRSRARSPTPPPARGSRARASSGCAGRGS